MRVCIHRGTREIGGNCVEIEHEGQYLVLDLGRPLTGAAAMPAICGRREGSSWNDLLGVFVSHAHLDHYGLASELPGHVPLYMGEATRRLIGAAARFGVGDWAVPHGPSFRHGETLTIGPFRVTPYLVDHSAYDSYAFLVETDSARLFYSGDLRAHGRKARLFEALVRSGPRHVDALLLEGTTLGRNAHAAPTREQDLEDEIAATLRQTKGLGLAMFSGQNIDRLVTVFNAARKSGRTLVMDPYQAHLVEALGNPRLPHPCWGRARVRVFLPRAQRGRLLASGQAGLLAVYKGSRIFDNELAQHPRRFVMTFRQGMRKDLERARCLNGAHVIYSMWAGYLKRPDDDLATWCASHGLPLVHHHTSGHAAVTDLQRLVVAMAPRRVVPIHTDSAERYAGTFPDVETWQDGSWYAIAEPSSNV